MQQSSNPRPVLLICSPVQFCAFLLVLLIVACGICQPVTASAPGSDPLEQVSLQLKWTHQFQFAGYYVAVEKGYYRDAGLNVTILEGSSHINPADQVTGGFADIGVGTSDIVLRRAEGSPLVVLEVIFQHSPLIFLVRQDSGISSIHDLAGKTVMMEAGSEELTAYLIHEGISPEKVQIIANQSNVSALIAGDVQAISAYSTTEPYLLEHNGIRYLSFTPRSSAIDFYGDNLFTTESYEKTHPETVKKFLTASRRGWEYALANPNETADLILQKYNPGLNRDQLLFEHDQMMRLIAPDVVQIGYMNPGRWKEIIATYDELGMIHQPVSLDIFLYNSNPKQDLTVYLLSIVILGILSTIGGCAFFYYRRLNRSLNREIEDRKRAEEALHVSEEKFRGIFDMVNDGIQIHDIDPDGRPGKFIEVNEVACRMLQYIRNELLERGPLDFASKYHSRPFNAIIGELSSTGHAIFETRHRRKDGTDVPVEINAHIVNLQDKRIVVSGVRDITERKRGEEALSELSTYNRSLIEASIDPLVTISHEGKIQDVNTATENATGLPRLELIGTDFSDYFTEPEKAREGYREVFLRGKVLDFPLEIRHRDGHHIPVLYNATVYRDRDGKIQGVFAAARDITIRKQAEDALHLANRKLNLLYGITRHDINNQLTVLVGYLRILEKKQPDPLFHEYFLMLASAAQRISAMIQFTREYESIGVHAPIWQDCRTLVDTAAEQVPPGMVRVINDLPAGAEVFADLLIVKVCYNLMDNAVRYGGKITFIRFSIEERDGVHVVVCEDDGDGVVAEEKERIFERGFGKNTGLGLALAREILDITGISIKETGEPGKGARFEMTVPKGMWRFT